MLTRMVKHTYFLTGLSVAEFESGRVTSVLESLNERFGKRLGLDANQIRKEHARLIRELHMPVLAS
jgi:hypothetical protein